MVNKLGRASAAFLVGGLTLVGGMGAASADDPNHTHEKIYETIGPIPLTVGGNPCTGEESQNGIRVMEITGEIEVEDGREHGEFTVRSTEVLENGFEAKVVENQNASIIDGEGVVNIELEVEAIHPGSGDNFGVVVEVVLTISGGDVVDVVEMETLTECQRGG